MGEISTNLASKIVGELAASTELGMLSCVGKPVAVAPGMWVSTPMPEEKPSRRSNHLGSTRLPGFVSVSP